MRKAIVVGCDGQDGTLLSDALLAEGCRLIGLSRAGLRGAEPGASGPVPLDDARRIDELVDRFQPDEIYYLAAFQNSSQDAPLDPLELYLRSHEVNVLGLVHFLEAVRRRAPRARLFYASSSHIFGTPTAPLLNESSPLDPGSVYGLTKAAGLLACRLYRSQHSVFAAAGILFNHESPRRKAGFVSKKIVRGALDIRRGATDRLVVGDLSAEADWGYAGDYVEAMRAVLACDRPDEFVVATGEKRSVADFVQAVFGELGLDWKRFVRQDPALLTRSTPPRIGDPSKLSRLTSWKPRTSFAEMTRLLLRAEAASLGMAL